MAKGRQIDLTAGLTLAEFVKTLDVQLWLVYLENLQRFIEAHSGEFRPVGVTGDQQRYQQAFKTAQRDLGRLALKELATKQYVVSGIMQGYPNRVMIEGDIVLTLTDWDLRLGTLRAPNGRLYEFVKVQPLKAKRGSKADFNWPGLIPAIAAEIKIRDYKNRGEFVMWCRENVTLCNAGEKPGKIPDDKTAREAITKYGLNILAKIAMA